MISHRMGDSNSDIYIKFNIFSRILSFIKNIFKSEGNKQVNVIEHDVTTDSWRVFFKD